MCSTLNNLIVWLACSPTKKLLLPKNQINPTGASKNQRKRSQQGLLYKRPPDVLEDKLKTLVCRTFQKNKKLQKKYISILNDNKRILTEDKRHIRLDKLALTDLLNYCKF